MKSLYLHFPQWQGSGLILDPYYGSKLLKQKLGCQFKFNEVTVSQDQEVKTKNGIIAYDQIVSQLIKTKNLITKNQPDQIYTLGGDCSVEVTPVSYLNQKYSSLIILWFDAHGDLNTPQSSPSQRFHGMPLRVLLGEGDQKITSLIFSKLKPEQLILVGTRDLDPPEVDYIKEKKIDSITSWSLLENQNLLIDKLRQKKFEKIYFHFDLDVIDPKLFPFVRCPVAGGLSWEFMANQFKKIKREFSLIGTSITEYAKADADCPTDLVNLVKLLFTR